MTWGRDETNEVVLTTTNFIPGTRIKRILGLVVGAEKLGRGGTNNVEEKTQEAIERLTSAAQHIDADAVIDLRVNPVQPAGQHGSDQNYSVFCYGTAVKLEPDTEN